MANMTDFYFVPSGQYTQELQIQHVALLKFPVNNIFELCPSVDLICIVAKQSTQILFTNTGEINMTRIQECNGDVLLRK